jgi:5'-methylthioadenosine phosphorylase
MTEPAPVALGVIGGSGFYDLPGAETVAELEPDTPFGRPSGPLSVLRLPEDFELVFLPRHGQGHVVPPHEVPYRANIFALKKLGVKRIVSINAVGSLVEQYAPGDLVLPSDLVDRTHGRPSTFFESGLVGHVGMAEPMCRTVRSDLLAARSYAGTRVYHGGTLVVIQGPRFSTRAESEMHRKLGFSLVGMTTLPEATLAREAEICYASLSLVTDYDVWHGEGEEVDAHLIIERLAGLAGAAASMLVGALPAFASRGACECQDALRTAIVTARDRMDPAQIERLAPIVGRYVS